MDKIKKFLNVVVIAEESKTKLLNMLLTFNQRY